MSQENVEIVRRFLDRAHAGPDRVWGIFDDSVVWEIGPLRTSRGARWDLRFWQAWEMRDGKAIRVTHHYEKADALDAIGTPD